MINITQIYQLLTSESGASGNTHLKTKQSFLSINKHIIKAKSLFTFDNTIAYNDIIRIHYTYIW